MAFSRVPKESRSRINKAGSVLASDGTTEDEKKQALELAEKWHACHAYPINTFQATLRRKVKKFFGEPIVAQRSAFPRFIPRPR